VKIFYSMVHTSENNGPGMVSRSCVSERLCCENALTGLQEALDGNGNQVVTISGGLRGQIRKTNEFIRAAQSAGERWVSVALHFNSTPIVECQQCKKKINAGIACPSCGAAPATNWKFGHMAMVGRYSLSSAILASMMLDELSFIMPFSKRLGTVRLPDENYKADWPPATFKPAVLIEAGFGCDLNFSDWIKDPNHQKSYGSAVARAITGYNKLTYDVPADIWHR